MFAIPGTDTPSWARPIRRSRKPRFEPSPLEDEIEFILETAGSISAKRPTRAALLSVFTGIRPLVKAGKASTRRRFRAITPIHISSSGLLTIAGGKWTTSRKMAEDAVDHAIVLARLPEHPCQTHDLHLHGFHRHAEQFGDLAVYGFDALQIGELIRQQPALATLARGAADHRCATRLGRARGTRTHRRDVLARRTRALFLNSQAALDMAPAVARLLAQELGRDEAWQRAQLAAFQSVATHYTVQKT